MSTAKLALLLLVAVSTLVTPKAFSQIQAPSGTNPAMKPFPLPMQKPAERTELPRAVVRPPQPKLPDLKVDRIYIAKYPDLPFRPLTGDLPLGEKVYLVCAFSNPGGDLKGQWKISHIVNGKPVYSQNIGDVPSGNQQAQAGWFLPEKEGDYHYECLLDHEKVIPELTRENNRMGGATFRVARPPIITGLQGLAAGTRSSDLKTVLPGKDSSPAVKTAPRLPEPVPPSLPGTTGLVPRSPVILRDLPPGNNPTRGARWCADYSWPSAPSSVPAGRTQNISLSITNCGTETWSNNLKLTYRLVYKNTGAHVVDGPLTDLPQPVVSPGQVFSINVPFQAPVYGADYLAKWDLAIMAGPGAVGARFSNMSVPTGDMPIRVDAGMDLRVESLQMNWRDLVLTAVIRRPGPGPGSLGRARVSFRVAGEAHPSLSRPGFGEATVTTGSVDPYASGPFARAKQEEINIDQRPSYTVQWKLYEKSPFPSTNKIAAKVSVQVEGGAPDYTNNPQNTLNSLEREFIRPLGGFQVSQIEAFANPAYFSGTGKQEILFTGRITTDGRGKVKYRWLRSDGGKTRETDLDFQVPGTKTVTTSWQFIPNKDKHYWKTLEILSPNPLKSNPARIGWEPPGFEVTKAVTVASTPAYQGECPQELVFNSQITVNGRGRVRYRVVRSDGRTGGEGELVFEGPGPRPVTSRWRVDGERWPTQAWLGLEILSPNPSFLPEPAKFSYACTQSATPKRIHLDLVKYELRGPPHHGYNLYPPVYGVDYYDLYATVKITNLSNRSIMLKYTSDGLISVRVPDEFINNTGTTHPDQSTTSPVGGWHPGDVHEIRLNEGRAIRVPTVDHKAVIFLKAVLTEREEDEQGELKFTSTESNTVKIETSVGPREVTGGL